MANNQPHTRNHCLHCFISVNHLADTSCVLMCCLCFRQAKARTTLNSEIMTLLTSLGISLNYALNFIEQEVSQEDLLYLSEEDLANFIPKLGPRRRLQQYIAEVKASRRLQEVEEEEEAADSEEEREEERRRKRKAEKEGKLDKEKKADKKADKEREKDSKAKKEADKSREKVEEKKEREKDKKDDKDRAKEKEKAAKRKDEEETETPRIKDRSLTNTANKPPVKDKADKADRADKADGSKRGEKDRPSEEKKGEKKKDKAKDVERQDRPVEKKDKRREEETSAANITANSSASSGGSMLMDRVDRSLRERKLTVSRPPSALGNNSPSVPSSPRSAQSDSGGETHQRKRSDSEVDLLPIVSKLNTTSTVASSTTTPEAQKKRRVNSLTGTELTGQKGVRSAEKDKQRDREIAPRSFIDDPQDNSGMHALLTKIGSELEHKPKKSSGSETNRGPALTLSTAQLAVNNHSGPQSGGHPNSAFSHSTPIATSVGANGNLALSRVASTPHTPTAGLQLTTNHIAPPSPGAVLSNPVLLSPSSTSTSTSSSSSSRPSSRPSSPSSRRGSQPLLSVPSGLGFVPSTPLTQHSSHNGLSRPASASVSSLPSSASSSVLLPPQHLSRLS